MKSAMLSEKLCVDDWLQDYLAAGNAKTGASALRKLASSSVDRVRLRVAENQRTPQDVLTFLASDHNPDVRTAVALNTSTPKALRKRLATDMDPSVRYAIAEDPNTDRDILLHLCDDANAYVAVRAQRTLDLQAPHVHRITRTVAGKGILKLIKGALNLRKDELRLA